MDGKKMRWGRFTKAKSVKKRKFIEGLDQREVARLLASHSAACSLDEDVGGAVDLVELSSTGVTWLTKKEGCPNSER